MKKLVLSLVVLLLPALPALAADAVASNPIGEALADLLTGVVFPFLSALLIGLVGVLLNKIRRKWGLEISAATQANIEKAALAGITFAEEKAAAIVKEKATKITGKEKLDLAVAHVLQMVPDVKEETARAMVESMLGRVFGAGATGQQAVTPS